MPSAVIPMPGRAATPADLRRKCLARLAERIDPARTRHKPLSLVRADARRQADAFFDAEAPFLPRTERDRLVEDVLATLPGVGPLEELFRDEAVAEILVLGPALVVAHKGGGWVPTSVQFRDAEQVRAVVVRFAEAGVPLQPGSPATGAVDVRLPTGFRALAVLPPEVMNVCPSLHLTRGPAVAAGAAIAAAGLSRSGSGVVITPAPRGGSRAGADVLLTPAPRGGSGYVRHTARPVPADSSAGAEVVSLAAATPPAAGGSMGSTSGRLTGASGVTDPYARLRQRMTEKIIMRLASAGVYDLNQVPLPELRKFITLAVGEFCVAEAITSDPAFEERLGLEILAGMNR